jgi:serine/threonine protein kinase
MTTGTKYGHAKFEQDSPTGKPFKDFYVIGELLGEGGHSYIYRAIRKSTKLPYAVKHIQQSKLGKRDQKTLKDEITVLKLLRGGPHIIRLFDVFEDKLDTHLIFEEMKGGNILARIVEKEVYTEREARQVCKIALMAVDYCHKKKVAHRDIKPENFLLVDEGDDTSVKLVDFAFAKKETHDNSLKTLCGTAQYVAPEILDSNRQGYNHKCDIWSLGVFAYLLLGGYPPFEGILDNLVKEITRGYFEFHEEYWSDISGPAKDMIRSMLVVTPEERVSASHALACKWMEIEEEQLVVRDLTGAQESIRKTLQPTAKVKMAVTAIIARNKFMSIAGMFSKEDIVNSNILQESMGIIDEWEDEETFGDLYLWGEQIGIGTFSVVHEVLHKETENIFAVKRVSRKDLHPSDAVALHDEIAALQQVTDCEHIVRLYDVFDEPDFTFLVLECMKGGDLIDRIIEKRHYTEYDAKEVSRKLIMGVAYCHKKKIANRNLKPENLLLKAGSDTDVKISDFGYAKTVTFPNSLRTQCGTEGYVAPEILEHRPAYDVPCDMWSLGVIIYIVLGGYRPFRGEGEEVMRQIRYGDYKFHKRYWSHVSDDAKNLITRMLTVDPEKRITAEAALRSPWINSDEDSLGTHELTSNMKDLNDLRSAKAKIKGAVNTIIATNKMQSIGGFRAYQDF